MKKIILYLLTATIFALSGCTGENCNGVITYSKIDSRLDGYLFKAGSYWVYRDSIDGIIDSQIVYSYSHRSHYRSTLDTPNRLYQQISLGSKSSIYCGPYYTDSLSESIISYQNGLFKDTLCVYSLPEDVRLKFQEYFHSHQAIEVDIFQLDVQDTGLVGKGVGVVPSSSNQDTTYLWYEGIQYNVSESGYSFNNVKVFRVLDSNINTARFKYPTDLYFASGYGIVKIVEHRPSGDVPWILVNYHIVN